MLCTYLVMMRLHGRADAEGCSNKSDDPSSEPISSSASASSLGGQLSSCLGIDCCLSCMPSSCTGYDYVCTCVCDPLLCCMHVVVHVPVFAPACLAVGAQLCDIREWKPVCGVGYSGRLLTPLTTPCCATMVLLVTFHWVRSSQSIHQCPERVDAYF